MAREIMIVQILHLAVMCTVVIRGQPPMNPMQPPPMQPPPKQQAFIGGIAQIDNHCSLRTDAAEFEGFSLRLGGMLELNYRYSPGDDQCDLFGGWASVQQSVGFLYALDQAGMVIPHRAAQYILSLAGQTQGLLGATIFDSCASALLGVTEAQWFITGSDLYRTTTIDTLESTFTSLAGQNPIAANVCIAALEESDLYSGESLLGIVGPMSTSAVTAVSPLLSVYNVPHISYWASSTLFDDTRDYPFLFRTVPSDASQVDAIADLVEHFGWSLVSLIAAEDDEYSGRGFELMRAAVLARETFCLDVQQRFSTRDLNATRLLVRRIKSRGRARALILYAPVLAAQRFLEACALENLTDVILIGSHDWVNRITVRDRSYAAGVPILGLAPRQTVSPAVDEVTRSLALGMRNATVLAHYVQLDPWLRAYVQSALGCQVPLDDEAEDCTVRVPPAPPRPGRPQACTAADYARFRPPRSSVIAESLIASVFAMGYAAADATFGTDVTSTRLPVDLPSGPAVRKALLDLRLPCPQNTTCRVFTAEQRTRPRYYIQNMQLLYQGNDMPMDRALYDVVSIGDWNPRRGISWDAKQTLDLKQFGSFSMANMTAGSSIYKSLPTSDCSLPCVPGQRQVFTNNRCCWVCEDCTGNTMSNSSSASSCTACALGTRSNATACHAIAPNQFALASVEYLFPLLLAIVGFALAACTLLYYYTHGEAVLVRASDLDLSTLTLVGMLVGYVFVPFVNITGPVNTRLCVVSTVLPEPVKTFVICTVLVKTKRFDSVFNSMKILSRHKTRRFFLGTPMQVVAIFGLTLINVALALLYGVLSPSQAVREPGLDKVSLYCDISLLWQGLMNAYNCCLLIVCIVLAFLTRNLPEEYNQAQLTYLASLTGFVVWLGLVPAYFVTGAELRPLISSLSLVCLLLAFWLCLFLPRLLQMLMHAKYRAPRSKGALSKGTSVPKMMSSGVSLASLNPSPIVTPLSTPLPQRRDVASSSPLTSKHDRVNGHNNSLEVSNSHPRPPPNHQHVDYGRLRAGSDRESPPPQETSFASASSSGDLKILPQTRRGESPHPYTVSNV